MSSLQMPKVDNSIMSKKDKIASDLRGIINSKNVLSNLNELRPFETDGLTAYRQMPLLVVMPETVEEVSQILKYCNENKIKVVPRGAGTGLSGHTTLCNKFSNYSCCSRQRFLLCSRPIKSDCMLYRWKCCRKFWWGSLPQVRCYY